MRNDPYLYGSVFALGGKRAGEERMRREISKN